MSVDRKTVIDLRSLVKTMSELAAEIRTAANRIEACSRIIASTLPRPIDKGKDGH